MGFSIDLQRYLLCSQVYRVDSAVTHVDLAKIDYLDTLILAG